MTHTPKTRTEIRDAEAEKYVDMAYGDINDKAIAKLAFVYGFDCRDKLEEQDSKLKELMYDAESLAEALETAEAAIAVFTVAAYGRYTPEDESFREVHKALAAWNAKYG